MKQYHTSIKIKSSLSEVWSELTNFNDNAKWNVIADIKDGEMILEGSASGARFLLSAKSYYSLKAISANRTELKYGEYFTGLFSCFISNNFVSKHRTSFKRHNVDLKKRIENSKHYEAGY